MVEAHIERADKAPAQQDTHNSWRNSHNGKDQREVTVPSAEREWDPDAGDKQCEDGADPKRRDGSYRGRASEWACAASVHSGAREADP